MKVNLDFVDKRAMARKAKSLGVRMTGLVEVGPAGGNPNADFSGSRNAVGELVRWWAGGDWDTILEVLKQ